MGSVVKSVFRCFGNQCLSGGQSVFFVGPNDSNEIFVVIING